MDNKWWALWVFKVPANIRWYSSMQAISSSAWIELFSTTVIIYRQNRFVLFEEDLYSFWEAILNSSTVEILPKLIGSQNQYLTCASRGRRIMSKIGFTSLLVFYSVASIEKNASAAGRRIETAYFVSCWSHLMILRSSHNYHQLPNITEIIWHKTLNPNSLTHNPLTC